MSVSHLKWHLANGKVHPGGGNKYDEQKIRSTNTLYTPFGNYNELHFMSSAVCDDLNCYIVGCGFFNVLFCKLLLRFIT